MSNNNYVTEEILKRELEKFWKELKNYLGGAFKDSLLSEVRNTLIVNLKNQELIINNRLENIDFWATLSETRNYDFRLKACERLLGIEKKD